MITILIQDSFESNLPNTSLQPTKNLPYTTKQHKYCTKNLSTKNILETNY